MRQRHSRGAESSREQLLREIQAHRQVLQEVVDNTPAGVAVFRGGDFLLEMTNPAYEVFAPGKQMRGRTFAQIWPEAADEILPILRQVIETGEPSHAVDRLVPVRRHPEGDLEDAYWTYNVVRLPQTDAGERRLLVTAIETTKQVRDRQQIERTSRQFELSLAQLEAVLDSMADVVVIVDPSGRLLKMNRAGLAIVGFDRIEEYLRFMERRGEIFTITNLDGQPMPVEDQPISHLLRGETFTGFEARYTRSDTGQNWIGSASGAPVRDQTGKMVLGVLTLRDVTGLRALEESREKFLRAITHDLRTPLTAVIGGAQVLRRVADRPAFVEKTAKIVEENAWRMSRMVSELADVARLEAGQLTVNAQPVDLPSIVFAVKDQLSSLSGAARIRVEIDEPPPLVRGDPDLLDRVLTNLLTNALKYSAEDTDVFVQIAHDRNEVTTSVVDRGEGIAPEHLPHLFERYFRVPTLQQRREGLGLGLYITRGLVQAQGGQISVTSRLGEGSTFSFTLPRFT